MTLNFFETSPFWWMRITRKTTLLRTIKRLNLPQPNEVIEHGLSLKQKIARTYVDDFKRDSPRVGLGRACLFQPAVYGKTGKSPSGFKTKCLG
jgi:hypothetical protein